MKNKQIETIKKICLKVKVERIKKEWSQEELAERTNLNKNTIGRIERNDITPSVESLIQLADVFDMTLSELVDISKI